MTKIKANRQYTDNMSKMLRKWRESGDAGDSQFITREPNSARTLSGRGILAKLGRGRDGSIEVKGGQEPNPALKKSQVRLEDERLISQFLYAKDA